MISTQSTRRSHLVVLMLALLLAIWSWGAYAHEDDEDLPHFKCFQLAEKGGAINEDVKLITQFGKEDVEVKNPHFLCAPTIKKRFCETDKDGNEKCAEDGTYAVADLKKFLEGLHLLCWKIAPSGPPVDQEVTLDSQFGDTDVKVQTAQLLCEPVKKEIKNH
jgi:hypothetical protein